MRRAFSWLSLLLAVSGCLVDDPPAYRAALRTAPRISGLRAVPRLDEIITYPSNSTEPVTFSVPIVSEDAGQEIQARLFLDYSGSRSDLVTLAELPASTLDEGERDLPVVWYPRPGIAPGCHRLTLRVSHTSNWHGLADLFDPSDLDEAYWFAKIYVDPTNINSLVDCPSASTAR